MTEPSATEPESTPPAPAACPTCGAPVAVGQEWCLECGSAQPELLTTRPPWRSAAALLGATGVLVAGASAAAYAGLSHESHRISPSTVLAAVPSPTAPPGATAPTTPPATATPPAAATTKAPSAATPPAAATPKTASATPSTTPSTSTTRQSSSTPTHQTSTPTGSHRSSPRSTSSPRPFTAAAIPAGAAAEFNPNGVTTSGNPGATTDGDSRTAWGATLDPNNPNAGAGIQLDLGYPVAIRKLVLQTTTVGMSFDVYGTNANPVPGSIDGWSDVKLSNIADSRSTSVVIDGAQRFQHLLVWIYQPPDGARGVRINELKLYR